MQGTTERWCRLVATIRFYITTGQLNLLSPLLTKSFTKASKEWPAATAKCKNGSPKGNAGIQVFYKRSYRMFIKKHFLPLDNVFR